MAASSKAMAYGGVGYTPTVDDVIKVATGSAIALDNAAAERLKKQSPQPKNFSPEQLHESDAAPNPSTSHMPQHLARAVLFTRLLTVVNGSTGVRVDVVKYLETLMNIGKVPCLDLTETDLCPLKQLADSCHGAGVCYTSEGQCEPLQSALESAGLAPPGLSTAERAVLQSGSAASAGVSAIVVQGSKQLLAAATAVAALACEALGAQVVAFDGEAAEAQGHKAVAGVADELRGLLEGSKQVGASKDAEDLPSVSCIPQEHGAAQEALASAYITTRAEVQSAALTLKSGRPPVQSPMLATRMLEVTRALLAVAGLSLGRTQLMTEGRPSNQAQPAGGSSTWAEDEGLKLRDSAEEVRQRAAGITAALFGEPGTVPSLAAASAAYSAMRLLQKALALEALVATVALRLQEGPAPANGSAAGADSTPPAGDSQAQPPQKKDKKKDRKGPQGVVLGKGTAVVRCAVEGRAAQGATGDAAAGVLPMSAEGAAVAGNLKSCYHGVRDMFEPLSLQMSKLVQELRGVIEANQALRVPKAAKGTRDYLPIDMAIRERAFAAITGVFKRHGAVSIDTPVFEVRETLMGKYGEDSKLIYDLADQGGEILSLRYDLTVPFARFVATHKLGNIKRYHIAKVYRRDQPQVNKGKFREFFQCDFDICGAYPTMVADAEVLSVLTELLDGLSLGDYTIKINHRRLLDTMLAIAGVPAQKFRTICSAIDKLDKEPWEAVRCEMVEEKGLAPAVADKIGEFVVLNGKPNELLDVLTAAGHPLGEHPNSKEALAELKLLFEFLGCMGALHRIRFDLSLARGLDYYTGLIFEAVLQGANMGSIAGGGRYDKLVGMFSGKDIPSVGMSVGIERIFQIMKDQAEQRAAAAGRPLRESDTEVYVASIGKEMQPRRMEICAQLWRGGIKAEFGYKAAPKMGDNLDHVLKNGIPFMVVFGETELANNVVGVKDMDANLQDEVPLADLVADLQRRIAAKAAAEAAAAQQAAAAAPPQQPAVPPLAQAAPAAPPQQPAVPPLAQAAPAAPPQQPAVPLLAAPDAGVQQGDAAAVDPGYAI